MEDFHPNLREMLRAHGQVRTWEYGMMVHGLPPLQYKKVLDIGSGPSLLPIYLEKRLKADVTVLELPVPYTVDCQSLYCRLRQAGVNLQVGDMREIPFADNSFDIVLSISVVEHLSHSPDHRVFPSREDFFQDTEYTLCEMYRVLRPGGWMYITSDAYVPGHVDHDSWTGNLLDEDPYAAYPIDQVNDIFVSTLQRLGASFPYPICFDGDLLRNDSRHSSYRHRFMTVFNLFAQKAE
jgi:SAM-dependent methyltransferase